MIRLKNLIIENKNPINDRLGKCYELSGKYVMSHAGTNAILVHGKLTNPFAKGHPEMEHAWVEIGKEIFDPVMDKTWPKDVYESLFKVKIYKKYTPKQMYQIIDKTSNWGPWENDKEKKTPFK